MKKRKPKAAAADPRVVAFMKSYDLPADHTVVMRFREYLRAKAAAQRPKPTSEKEFIAAMCEDYGWAADDPFVATLRKDFRAAAAAKIPQQKRPRPRLPK